MASWDPPGPPALPKDQANAFLAAWTAGDTAGMTAQVVKAPADLNTLGNSLVKSAPGSHARYTLDTLKRAQPFSALPADSKPSEGFVVPLIFRMPSLHQSP